MSDPSRVGIVMGSDSHWPTAEPAALALAELGVASEVRVLSAHRTPQVEVLLDELLQAQVLHQGGRQQEPRIGHQTLVVKGRFKPVEAVR